MKQWEHIAPQVLILATKRYIVFIKEDGDVDWETTTDYDKEATTTSGYDRDKLNSVLNDAALVETTPSDGLSQVAKLQFKRLVGEAIARGLDHDYDGAKSIISSAGQFIRARTRRNFSILVSIGKLRHGRHAHISRHYRLDFPSVRVFTFLTPIGMWLALSGVAGAIGALLSVIWRSGDLKFSPSSGEQQHYLEASCRILAGALSGFLAAIAIKAEIILTAFTHGQNLHSIMILAGLAAGSSERLIGSIISKFEVSQIAKSTTTKSGKGGE